MIFNRKKLSDKKLLEFYQELITPRLIENRMLVLLRQGKISKWFSGIGQEATSVGAALAMNKNEFILPMHRNLGVFTTRKVPLNRLFAQFQGKSEGFTNGRDRSFHFGTTAYHLVGMISHLGPQLALADGIALAEELSGTKNVSLVFTGDGGSSEGDFHEALNVAAVWDLPVIFMVENNGYGLSTPSSEQFKFDSFVQKGPAYGIDAFSVDGNNVLDVYHAVGAARRRIKQKPQPILIEALTFRMRGHEEASGTKYVPKKLMEEWAAKDPIMNYENFLIDEEILTEEKKQSIHKKIKEEIEKELTKAYGFPEIKATVAVETSDVYCDYQQNLRLPETKKTREMRFVDAVSDGLTLAMTEWDNLILMGQDIADYGGVFKVTEGLLQKFGKKRVRNTPLCESAIIGTALGLSINGYKSMVEMQFADFVTCGFNQIVNNLAKVHYRWKQQADVVIRMPTGAGVGAGPFHSQSNEAWFFHVPGLKIVYPSNPIDAKGLLLAALEDPNPYLFFEHKFLYRSVSEEVPIDFYTTEIGKAAVHNFGSDFCIITYGMGYHWAKKLMESPDKKYQGTIVDLRSLVPWDKQTVAETVKNTNRVIILHEDNLTGGIGGELAAWIAENCFEWLDAPIVRVASLDTPVPFAPALEGNYLPEHRLKQSVEKLLDY
jgi:2-oxoisovalerate dehydrogenase E1 component